MVEHRHRRSSVVVKRWRRVSSGRLADEASMGDVVGCRLATERDASTWSGSPPGGSGRRSKSVVTLEPQSVTVVSRGWGFKTHDASSGFSLGRGVGLWRGW